MLTTFKQVLSKIWKALTEERIYEIDTEAIHKWSIEHYDSSRQEIAEKLASIICQQIGCDLQELHPNVKFIEDLGHHDALDQVRLVMAIEDTFNVHIPDKEAEKMFCFNDVVGYVYSYKKPR